MAEASVILAIGAAGAFQRAGLPFPLPARWEDEQGDWSDDDRVREAFGADDDDQAERILRKRIKDARLEHAADLVMRRRYQEVALGVREDDSTLARIARAIRDGAMDYLLPAGIKRAFERWERDTRATMRDLSKRLGVREVKARDVLDDTDAQIDKAIARAGYRIEPERTAVSVGTVDLAPMVEVGGTAATLAPAGVGSALAGSVYNAMGMAAKGFAGTPLGKAAAQTFERATDATANRGRDLGIGIAIGVAAVVVLLVVTRR